MKPDPRSVKEMLWSVTLFSVGHAAVKWVPHISFSQLAFLRAAITALICLAILRQKKISFKGRNHKVLLLRGLAGTIALLGYFYALQNMPLASAVSIQYLSPILTLVIAHYLLREQTGVMQWVCCFIAFAGVLMIKGFDPRVSNLAMAASLISVVASAFAYNFVRLLRKTDHEMVVVLYFPLVTLPLTAPLAISGWVWPSLKDWFFILLLGVCTQMAQVLMTMAYHRERAADIAIYNYFGIFLALGIGYYFFNETFSFWSTMGIFVILSAIVLGTVTQPRVGPAGGGK